MGEDKPAVTVDERVLDEIIRRIVAIARPERIIMFGSMARRQAGPNSDVDLLVIKSGQYHRRKLAQEIHMSLFGVDQAVDVIVATPEDIERYRDSPALVIYPALREGRVGYVA